MSRLTTSVLGAAAILAPAVTPVTTTAAAETSAVRTPATPTGGVGCTLAGQTFKIGTGNSRAMYMDANIVCVAWGTASVTGVTVAGNNSKINTDTFTATPVQWLDAGGLTSAGDADLYVCGTGCTVNNLANWDFTGTYTPGITLAVPGFPVHCDDPSDGFFDCWQPKFWTTPGGAYFGT